MLPYLSVLDTPEHEGRFEELYHSYRYLMYHVAFEILRDRQLAEDAVHEAFIRIAKNFHKVGAVDCPQTKNFAVIIVRNAALTMVKQAEKVTVVDEFEHLDKLLMADDAEADLLRRFEWGVIVQTVLELPLIYKDILYLHFVGEYSAAEISPMLNLPRETVKKRIQRGRKILMQHLLEKGVQGR